MPGIIWVHVIRHDIPQLVSTVPLRTGTALHVLFCTLLLSSTETDFFREISHFESIDIIIIIIIGLGRLESHL